MMRAWAQLHCIRATSTTTTTTAAVAPVLIKCKHARQYTLNVVPITKPKKEKTLLPFSEALTMLRCYALPSANNRPETLEVQMVLNNLDKKKKTRQLIRGSVLLPHATGKKKKVLVLTSDPSRADLARQAGADEVGGLEYIEKFMDGDVAPNKFDIIIATSEMEKPLKPAAKVLRALLPTTKRGTIVENVNEAVLRFKNSVQFKTDAFGLCHAGVGKLSFSDDELRQNASAFINAVKENSQSTKGKLIQKLHVSSTRGPSIRLNVTEFD